MLHKSQRVGISALTFFTGTSTAALAPARTGSWTFSVVIPIEITPDQNTQGGPPPLALKPGFGPSSSEASELVYSGKISASPDWVHILGRSIQGLLSMLTVFPSR